MGLTIPVRGLEIDFDRATRMKINLGCGNKKIEGFVGVDRYRCDGSEILCDLTKSLPFADDSIDAVIMDDFIEHILDICGLLREVARVCRKGARVVISTPHYSSGASWRNPTHFHHLSWFAFDQIETPNHSYYMGHGLKLVGRKLSFGGGLLSVIGKLLFKLSPSVWEHKFCFLFRASTLRFELEATKA